MPLRAPLSLTGLLLILLFSCTLDTETDSDSESEQSYIEFKLDPSSPLSYGDVQSIKVFVDPYLAFNLKGIFDEGRSVLGAYDYDEDSEIYMGYKYDPLYTCRLKDLSVSVTRAGSQVFIDSPDYTLKFLGEMPEDAADKPYVSISITTAEITLTAVQGAPGSPVLSLTEQ